MKKYEIIVDPDKAKELTDMLEKLPYVRHVREADNFADSYTLVSEKSLAEDWLPEEDDELQKLYGK
jgi:hypothetical protein